MTHFMSVSRLLAALSGGKAPACWWRGIVQKTAKLVAMRRGDVWVQEFGDIHPRLCEYPLLGYTLTSLTRQTEHTQEASPETTRSGKMKLFQWASPLKPNRNVATAGKPIVSQHRTATPIQSAVTKHKVASLFQIKAQADRLLLSRLAGGELAFDRTLPVQNKSFSAQGKRSKVLFPSSYENSANQQDWLSRLAQRAGRASITTGAAKLTQNNTQIPPLQEQWAMPLDGMSAPLGLLNQSFSAEGKRSEAHFPSSYRDLATQQEWLSRLAQRAARAGSIQSQFDSTGTAKLTQNNVQIPDHLPSLQEQWAMPLNGMCASFDLLNRIVQEYLPGDKRISGAAPFKASHSPGQVEKADESSQRLDNLDGWRDDSASDGHEELGPKATLPGTAQAGAVVFAPEFDLNGSAGHGSSESKRSGQIIPPDVMPSLPDLLTPQRVGEQPLPVSAATARQNAHEEGLKAADELDVLAEKIKQILDEQARRHGIDV
jgi:hypothetical protein